MSPPSYQKNEDESNVMAPMTSDYNKLNESQSTVWKYAKPLFARAMEDLPIGKCLRVADLGCATGGNSVAPLSFISSQLVRNPDCALEVFMGDLPTNAWSAVVCTVTPDSITKDYERSPEDTFVYMVGRSFYECCARPESLDLSYSLVAVHWMKSYPGDLPSGLYATDPKHVPESELLQDWREAGVSDFLDFTRARHRELKVGGRFIGAVACPKANGHFPWSRVGLPLHQALASKVSPEILASCVLPCCWRTEENVRAGFEDVGWEIEICEFHETKDPVREKFERGEITPAEYGKSVIESFAAVCHPTCVTSLVKFMPVSQVEQLLEEAYEECIETIAADPDQFNLDVSFWYIMARKTSL